MVGVIAGQPLESGRIEVLAPQCGRRLVQGVQVGDELLYATVVRPIESIPIHRTVMIPFAVLRHLIAHEGELFARMGPLVGEQRAHAGIALPVIARHLAEQRALAVHDLVVADRQHIMLRVCVHHGEGDLVVVPLTVDRLLVQILQGVVHPTHVPLEAEAQTAGIGRCGDAGIRGGFLGDHHDARIVLVRGRRGFLEEVDGLEVFSSTVDVRMPLARLAAVIQVQHRGDRVHAQRVDMVLVQPEAGVGHQEVAHFAASEIEHIGAPIRMLATGRVRILVQRRAIESAKGERVLREMRRNPVHDHADAGLVHLLDEILEVVRAAKARINRVIAGYLITPRAGEGMLGQRHEFHMGETFLLDVGDQLVGQFAIVLHILAPARGMDLVDADRTVVRVGLGSLVHPVLVMPRMDGVDDDGTGARRNLMRTLHRIGLHDPFVVGVEDLVLVNRSRFDTRNE